MSESIGRDSMMREIWEAVNGLERQEEFPEKNFSENFSEKNFGPPLPENRNEADSPHRPK